MTSGTEEAAATELGNVPGFDMTRVRRTLLVVDIVESVRLMQRLELQVIQTWRWFVHRMRDEVLSVHAGRLVKSLGDGLLVEFEAVHDAVAAAQQAMALMSAINRTGSPPGLRLQLRMGIHIAEVVVDELDIYGTGVNMAARLAALAGPDEIVVSSDVRDLLLPGVDPEAEDLGDCWLKHFDEPIRTYRLCPTEMPGEKRPDRTDLRPVLAILPLLPKRPDSRLACLGELFASEVQGLVLPNATLKVIARASSVAVAARHIPPLAMRDVLQADYILSGTIEGEDARLLLCVQIQATDRSEPLWQTEVRVSVDELHSADGEAAHAIAEAVGDTVLARNMLLGRLVPLPNLHAHALLFGGVALMHRFSRSDFVRARELLVALQDRAPRHGLPCAWLARWHLFAVIQGWSTNVGEDTRQAQDLARRALDLDADSSLAMTIAGSVRLQLLHDIVQAQALYRRALEVNPQESLAWLLLGTALGFQSRGDEAVRHSETAMSLSPVDPMRFFYFVHASATALAAGRYERAIELAQRAMKANRQHTSTYRSLAIAQSLCGRVDEARQTIEQLLVREPRYSVRTFLDRSAGAKFGQGERFAQALREAGLPESS